MESVELCIQMTIWFWKQRFSDLNRLAHDYDGMIAKKEFEEIVGEFYNKLTEFCDNVEKYFHSEDAMDHFE